LPPGARHVRGDRTRDDDLSALAHDGPWDVTVDISGKVPVLVRRSAQILEKATEHYVSISTVLVYRDWPHAPIDEASPIRACEPDFDPGRWTWEPELYGRLKAGCEAACRESFGDDRVLVLRLHDMVGQHEDVGALRWWLDRMGRGGPVIAPAPDRPIQPVDVRDVSRFLVELVSRRATGTVNVAAPPGDRTYGEMLAACAEVTAGRATEPPQLVWADEDWLAEQGVREWTGLPLWRRAAAPWDVDVERAVMAGLRCRPLAETVADTWRWLDGAPRTLDHRRITQYGIAPAYESDLISRWRRRAARPGGS
jgi:uncharacterized protein YbjT (DUF2867 family)